MINACFALLFLMTYLNDMQTKHQYVLTSINSLDIRLSLD
jgi:hypothetical protein